eukprot:TRINITY_DN3850_c0_g1_i1.p1 TRINITY_DN3850_c0_g1~~TRINITY_DN3850_c0_g1_i1.p1  ORF type:complete len:151 (+),score=29.59 TRINITY_DN3850_c0_g1_i1:28-480(+)
MHGYFEFLDDEKLMEELASYTRDHFISEYVDFILATKKYKTMNTFMREKTSYEIYEEYIMENAENGLGCINFEIREKIEQHLNNEEFPKDLFFEIEQAVLLDFKLSILPEFYQQQKKKSSLYYIKDPEEEYNMPSIKKNKRFTNIIKKLF